MKPLWLAYAALLSLTLVSLASSLLPLGRADLSVALAIAASKASVVGLYFMKLREGSVSARVAALFALAFVVLLVGFSTSDVLTR